MNGASYAGGASAGKTRPGRLDGPGRPESVLWRAFAAQQRGGNRSSQPREQDEDDAHKDKAENHHEHLVGLSDAATGRERLLEGARGAVSRATPPAVFPGAAGAPVARPLVIAPTGLPLAASLVGRDEALADLMAKLRAGTTSGVFALEGMGGVGKTALAAEAVARLAEDMQAFPGGAAWITCEGLVGEAGLAELWARVARALQLEQVAAQPDPQKRRILLAAALAQGKRLLLALDNIEPGLDAEAALETLAVRNRTALLLTARQRVVPQRVAAIDLAALLPDGARMLFLEQLARNGGDPPTPAEEPALAALLEALGGLPLALELTAAYAGVQRLGLAVVMGEVEADGLNALAFQSDPKRAPLKRFERSWLALSARQQRLFASLSLLAGASFPRAAALALAAVPPDETDPPEPEDDPRADLPTLVSYALVEALPGGERLKLHPLLREYAAQKLKVLAPVQQARLGDAMVAFWLAYAQAHPGYEGMDALEAEAAGLMGAVEWAHEQARHREVLALVHALSRAWNVRGRRDEQQRLYVWVGEAAWQVDDIREQAWAAHHLALTHQQTGRLAEARLGYQRALELARKMNSPEDERDEVHSLASLNYETGRLAEARAGFERALALAQQLGDPAAERGEVHSLAVLNWQAGRLAEARAGFEQALALARQVGDPAAEQDEVHGLATLDADTGQMEEARAGYERALALARQLGDPAAEREEIHELAWLDRQIGQMEEARAGYERALALARQVGDPAAERGELHGLAVLDYETGRLAEARAGYERALELARQLDDPAAEREELHGLAVLDFAVGRLEEARTEYERALELAQQLGNPAAEATELSNFGDFLAQQGEPDRGRELMMQGLAISYRLSNIYEAGKTHELLGLLDIHQRNRLGAIAHFREALRCFEQVESPDAEEMRAALNKLEKLKDRVELTREEAERAAQDATFLAERYGLAADDPKIPALQEEVRQALAQVQQPPGPEQAALGAALRAYLNTDSWPETRAVLEREQGLLLTDEADQFLSALIERAHQSDDLEEKKQANLYAIHLLLLRRARVDGIPAAWAWFESAREGARQGQGNEPPTGRMAFTREEAERATQDAAFLAEKLGLNSDDPQLPVIQQQLRDALAGDQDEE